MKLSLVVATVDRTQELLDLFASFASQSFRDFEVILVDQNADERLAPLVARFQSHFSLLHIRSSVRNVSHARNLGLRAATAPIVGFPDDDCLFQRDTTERVSARFEQEPDLGVLAGNYVNPQGRRVNGRWTPVSCAIDDKSVWTTVQASSLWVRTEAALAVDGFDPRIGPGTQWGSGEEPDFVIRVLRSGYRGYYDVSLGVLHPDKSLTPVAGARAFKYGAGMGRVLRKHAIAFPIILPYFIRPVGGALISLLRARIAFAAYYWGTFRGRLFGYLAPPAA